MTQRRFIKLTLYVPEEAEGSVRKAKEIFKRENLSISKFVMDKIAEYNRLHEPGNPQQRLDTVMAIGHAYRAESCCICSKKAEVQAFTKQGLNLLYCWECYETTGHIKASGFREIIKKNKISSGGGTLFNE